MSDPSPKTIRFLVVDDNPAIHEDVQKIFAPKRSAPNLTALEADLFGTSAPPESPGVRIDGALQGEQGFSMCQQALEEKDPYAVAVVDMRMPPGWDGLTTIERLWGVDPMLQVVICTAYSDHSWADITARLGPHDNLLVLKKPFDGIELHQMATSLGRKWTLQRAALADRESLETRMLLAERMASIGTLVGGVAHEINNPLAFVVANLRFIDGRVRELLAKNPSQPMEELATVVEESSQGAERIRRIVGDLKTLSRGDDRSNGPVNLRRCLELSISMAMNQIRHCAQLVTDWQAVPEVSANESRLGQVFLNLLVNAAQAISVGHADQNAIRVATGTDEAGRARIEISDTGGGIPEGVRARLFEPFFTTKPIGQGTGLGLSISKEIVKSFGGELELHATSQMGTTFWVTLPAAGEQPAARPSAPAPETSGQRRRILIVDDELPLARSLRRNLREHDVECVGSGREALQVLAREARFDLVLCDLMMPEMTGVELYEEIRRIDPQLLGRVAFMTGGVFSADADAFLKRTAPPLLEKPIDLSALRSLIDGAAGSARS